MFVGVGDNATRDILEGILKDEDGYVNEIEERLEQIKQMGVPHFLALQAVESASCTAREFSRGQLAD